MIRRLPTYQGYAVDVRLREFRKVPADELPEFVSFDSELGRQLLIEIIMRGLADEMFGEPRSVDS